MLKRKRKARAKREKASSNVIPIWGFAFFSLCFSYFLAGVEKQFKGFFVVV
jgi:hypothetical protein